MVSGSNNNDSSSNNNDNSVTRIIGGRIFDRIYRVLREGNVTAFWRGNGPIVFSFVPKQLFSWHFKDKILSVIPAHSRTAVKRHWWVAMLPVKYPFQFAQMRLALDPQVNGTHKFVGFVDCLCQTVHMGGFQSLYTGLAMEVLGQVTYKAVYSTLESNSAALKEALGEDRVGLAIALTAGAVCYPFRTVQLRMVMQAGQDSTRLYKGPLDCVAHVFAEEGVGGFYRGWLTKAVLQIVGELVDYVSMVKPVVASAVKVAIPAITILLDTIDQIPATLPAPLLRLIGSHKPRS